MIYKWLYPKRWALKRRNKLEIEREGLQAKCKFMKVYKPSIRDFEILCDIEERIGQLDAEIRHLNEQWLS